MAYGDNVSFSSVEVLKETDSAILCVIDGTNHWIPKSQISDDSEVYEMNTSGTLIITEWLAVEKGLA
jgi:hypothetical protein